MPVRSKGFDFLGRRRGCPRGDPAVQFVDVTVDECGVGGVEALGESKYPSSRGAEVHDPAMPNQ
jgi:hypothetical protein